MDDYSDLEFVETRNAPNDRQRRTTMGGHSLGGGGGGGGFTSIGSTSGGGGGGRTFMLQPRSQYGQAPYYPPQGYGYPPPGYGLGIGVPGATLFGRMSTGQVIDMVAQIFAALMPLPAAPVATADAATDVGNLITYQSSLAQYAKRDEQVRTLGNLVVKLVG